jgi:hypothetical protein
VTHTPFEMGEEGNDDQSEELRAAKRRIEEHPGYKEYRELEALERSIIGVFVPNLHELVALLDAAATNEELAIELVQNVREPVVRDEFHAQVTQRLHNYLASAQSLVDYVRRLIRGRTGKITEEFERRKAETLRNLEVPFMVDLRNYTLHRTLPFLGHRLSLTQISTPEQKMESEVQLSTAQLLAWRGWSSDGRAFLEQSGEAVFLRPVVKRHGQLLLGLNSWLHNELSRANDPAREEANELVVDLNTILTGGDRETAERRSRRDFS